MLMSILNLFAWSFFFIFMYVVWILILSIPDIIEEVRVKLQERMKDEPNQSY